MAIKIGNTMKALVAVLVIALSVSMVVADEAELIVAKTIMTRNPVANAEMLVSVRIFNVGTGPAYDLTLNDNSWLKENFTADAGLLNARWEKLGPGENITHNFVVIPAKPQVLRSPAATVVYHNSARGGKESVVFSSVPNYGYVRIYRPNEVPNRALPHYFEWTVFAGIIGLAVLLPALSYSSARKAYAEVKRK